MTTKYTYSVSTHFPNQLVDNARLHSEISSSEDITIALDGVNVSGDVCDIVFKDDLPGTQPTTLSGVVLAHTGESSVESPLPVSIYQARYDSDSKQVMVITPAPRGSFTWYTSRGDVADPLERGAGEKALITISGGAAPGVYTKELQFAGDGGVYIHDGEMAWRNEAGTVEGFGGEDEVSIYIKFPATTDFSENGGGTGNCNLYPIGGPYNAIVPAAGDGGYDVDLDKAVPVPDSSGVWVVNEKTGVIQPYMGDTGDFDVKCSLLDFTPPIFYLICKVGMVRSPGVFEIDAYLVEWVSRHWKICMDVDKKVVPSTRCQVGAWLMLFRWDATING